MGTSLIDRREQVDRTLGLYRHSVLRVREEKSHLERAKIEVEHLLAAQEIFQQVAQKVQQQAHSRISGVVTKCLGIVFEDPYEFRIGFERKRGKTEARLLFVRDGHEVDPKRAAGGGVVDIAAFALRVACLSLRVPRLRSLIVLDEPFRFVAVANRLRIRAMLEVLAIELGFQFVIVTHQEELKIGTLVEL